MFDGRWRHAVDRGTQPVGRVLVRAHVTADVLTIFGLVMSVVTAVRGRDAGTSSSGSACCSRRGCPTSSTGPSQRLSGTSSVRGAFLDSVADRISDGFMFGGVAWFLVDHHDGEAVLVPFAILGVTSLISYQRAKAELLGIAAKGGLMERAERFILLGLCLHRRLDLAFGLRPVAMGVSRPGTCDRGRSFRQGHGCRRRPRPHSGRSLGSPRGSLPACGRPLARGEDGLPLAGMADRSCSKRRRRSPHFSPPYLRSPELGVPDLGVAEFRLQDHLDPPVE